MVGAVRKGDSGPARGLIAGAKAISQKMARLEAGGRPRVLDLFAGCGGLSLGFQAEGFELRGSVEFEPDAARSYGLNFHGGAPEHCRARDITTTRPEGLASELDLGPVGMAVDIVVGGPPCQAFARVGRPKLREIDEHPQAYKRDPRARLYQEYLRYVDALQPLAVVMENVPDVLNHGGQNIAEEICEVLEQKGYVCGYTLLNAAFYGVPQMRERMFLLAYRQEITDRVAFPAPTHWVDLPAGYEGSRSVALKLLDDDLFREAHSYIDPPAAGRHLRSSVTAAQAIGDLPPIYAREELKAGRLRRGARRFDEPLAYTRNSNLSAYAKAMRSWPGFEAPGALRDHVIRYLPRDFALFALSVQDGRKPHLAHRTLSEIYPVFVAEGGELAPSAFAGAIGELFGRVRYGAALDRLTDHRAELSRAASAPFGLFGVSSRADFREAFAHAALSADAGRGRPPDVCLVDLGPPALARLGHAWEETLERFFAEARSRFSGLPVLAVTQDNYVHRRVGAIMRKVGEDAKGTGSAETSVSCVPVRLSDDPLAIDPVIERVSPIKVQFCSAAGPASEALSALSEAARGTSDPVLACTLRRGMGGPAARTEPAMWSGNSLRYSLRRAGPSRSRGVSGVSIESNAAGPNSERSSYWYRRRRARPTVGSGGRCPARV